MIFSIDAPALAQTPTTKVTPTPTPLRPVSVPETGVNITLSPTFLSLVTDPEKEVEGQFKVRNNNNFTEYFELSLAKFEAAEGGARPLLVPLTSKDEFREWIEFSEKQFMVEANETKTINVNIEPPKSASLGYYYAILVNRIQDKESESNGAVVAGAPALLTLLEVKTPNAQRELQVLDFTTEHFIYEYLPTTFSIKVKNNGNIHTAPVGDIFIDSGKKKNIAILHINEGRGNVLPATERIFSVNWGEGMITRVPKEENGSMVRDGKGNVVYETKFDFDKPLSTFRIGKYTANLLLVYDNGERDIPVEATVSFWVIPYKLILGAILVLFLPVAIIFGALRMKKRKNKK